MILARIRHPEKAPVNFVVTCDRFAALEGGAGAMGSFVQSAD